MGEKIFEIYITKYALTQGIYKTQATKSRAHSDDMSDLDTRRYYFKSEWHQTLSEAQIQAEQMRLKKIKNLKKQLQKFENMTF